MKKIRIACYVVVTLLVYSCVTFADDPITAPDDIVKELSYIIETDGKKVGTFQVTEMKIKGSDLIREESNMEMLTDGIIFKSVAIEVYKISDRVIPIMVSYDSKMSGPGIENIKKNLHLMDESAKRDAEKMVISVHNNVEINTVTRNITSNIREEFMNGRVATSNPTLSLPTGFAMETRPDHYPLIKKYGTLTLDIFDPQDNTFTKSQVKIYGEKLFQDRKVFDVRVKNNKYENVIYFENDSQNNKFGIEVYGEVVSDGQTFKTTLDRDHSSQ
ncbi:MAG: hypothetical protein HQM11_20945 [SAR324 cluster bacterium]|nr:hypothetical protein [SAR324 cluster bacterium]